MTTPLAEIIELVDPATLTPYSKNARVHSVHQVDKIAKSIKEFGFINPILIDETNGVIAGHGRLEAALKLKLPKVPTIKLGHLTEKQRKAFVLADNRIAEDARWDYAILKEEIFNLDGMDFDLETIGFTDTEIENLLPDLEAEADAILKADAKKHQAPALTDDDDSDEDESEEEEETVQLKKEVIGAKEFSADEFQEFEHTCPRCSFGFN